jgi:preprotein translocase subunit YajC
LGSSTLLIVYVVAFIAIFYFMAIRPQQRQRRAHAELISSLKKGDQVVTAGGMYGTVKRIDEGIVVVEIARGVSIKVARRAIAEVIRDKQLARATAPEGAARRGRGEAPEFDDEPVDDDSSADAPADSDSVSGISDDAPQPDSVLPRLRGRTRKPR